jgi:hypothetical protein
VAEPGGTLQGLCTIPEALWELLVGLYFTFIGFRPSPILSGTPRQDGDSLGTPAVSRT